MSQWRCGNSAGACARAYRGFSHRQCRSQELFLRSVAPTRRKPRRVGQPRSGNGSTCGPAPMSFKHHLGQPPPLLFSLLLSRLLSQMAGCDIDNQKRNIFVHLLVLELGGKFELTHRQALHVQRSRRIPGFGCGYDLAVIAVNDMDHLWHLYSLLCYEMCATKCAVVKNSGCDPNLVSPPTTLAEST